MYRFDSKMNTISADGDKEKSSSHSHDSATENPRQALTGMFLRKPSPKLASHVPQVMRTFGFTRRSNTLSESLTKLRQPFDDSSLLATTSISQSGEGQLFESERWSDDPCEFEDYDIFESEIDQPSEIPLVPVLPLGETTGIGQVDEKNKPSSPSTKNQTIPPSWR